MTIINTSMTIACPDSISDRVLEAIGNHSLYESVAKHIVSEIDDDMISVEPKGQPESRVA